MRILRDHLPADSGRPIYAIGNFDGLHLGHRQVIQQAITLAREEKQLAGVISFEPHPKDFFARGKFARLTGWRQKVALLGALGVDLFACLRFNSTLASMEAADFINAVLLSRLRASHLLVGKNFHFGKNRQGDFALLRRLGGEKGLRVHAVQAVRHAGAVISSSRIRRALAAGELEQAAGLLGRWWSLSGRVRRGDARGRQLGFPTANLPQKDEVAQAGVYAVYAALDEMGAARWHGVANLGHRPTFPHHQQILEVHCFAEVGDLYGKRLKVWPVAFLRAEQKFNGLDALRQQIAADKEVAQKILTENSATNIAPLA